MRSILQGKSHTQFPSEQVQVVLFVTLHEVSPPPVCKRISQEEKICRRYYEKNMHPIFLFIPSN